MSKLCLWSTGAIIVFVADYLDVGFDIRSGPIVALLEIRA